MHSDDDSDDDSDDLWDDDSDDDDDNDDGDDSSNPDLLRALEESRSITMMLQGAPNTALPSLSLEAPNKNEPKQSKTDMLTQIYDILS